MLNNNDYEKHVEELFRSNNFGSLFEIIKEKILNLKEIYENYTTVDQIKGKLIELKSKLEDFDYIKILFQKNK